MRESSDIEPVVSGLAFNSDDSSLNPDFPYNCVKKTPKSMMDTPWAFSFVLLALEPLNFAAIFCSSKLSSDSILV